MEDSTVLFITYFELSENISLADRVPMSLKVTSSGLFPPKGVNIVHFDLTPDSWGIIVLEAESAADVQRTLDVWRAAAGPGFFKSTKTAPAMPVKEAIPLRNELVKALAK
jgi:hypothetical protein